MWDAQCRRGYGAGKGSHESLASVIGSIKAPFSLFVSEDEKGPVSTVICVQDGDLAGVLDLKICRRRAPARAWRNRTGNGLEVGQVTWSPNGLAAGGSGKRSSPGLVFAISDLRKFTGMSTGSGNRRHEQRFQDAVCRRMRFG